MSDQTIQKEELKRQYEEIKTQEFRTDVRLADNEQATMSPEMQQYHTVQSAIQENARIEELLQNASILQIPVEERQSLKFRVQRNSNFQLINMEKLLGDSAKMVAVKESVKEIDRILGEPMGYALEREDKINLAREKMEEGIRNCDIYISRGEPFWPWHKKRYRAVVATRAYMADNLEKLKTASAAVSLNEELLKKEDTILDLINRPKVEFRRGKQDMSDIAVDTRSLTHAVHGLGSMEYEITHFDRILKKEHGKNNVDRTTEMVAFSLMEAKGGVYTNIIRSSETYRVLRTDLFDKSVKKEAERASKREKEAKVRLMEECFDMILKYDMSNFEFASFSETVRSPKFRENYRMAKMAFDCEIFIQDYRDLLKDDRGITLENNKKEFELIEKKRDEMGKLTSYYDILINYYEKPAMRNIDIDALFKLSYEDLLAKYEEVSEKKDPDVIQLYTLMLNLKVNGMPDVKLATK